MFFDGTYLIDAGWIFLAGWSLVVLAVGVIAFGKDVIPAKSRQQ